MFPYVGGDALSGRSVPHIQISRPGSRAETSQEESENHIKVKKFIEEIRKTSEDRRRSCEGTLEKRGGPDGARGSDGDSTVLQVLGRDGLPQIISYPSPHCPPKQIHTL